MAVDDKHAKGDTLLLQSLCPQEFAQPFLSRFSFLSPRME